MRGGVGQVKQLTCHLSRAAPLGPRSSVSDVLAIPQGLKVPWHQYDSCLMSQCHSISVYMKLYIKLLQKLVCQKCSAGNVAHRDQSGAHDHGLSLSDRFDNCH